MHKAGQARDLLDRQTHCQIVAVRPPEAIARAGGIDEAGTMGRLGVGWAELSRSTRGEKFSSDRSARRAISNSKARPRSCSGLSVIARLFELSIAIGKVVLLPGGARRRKGSPCGGSILMTSAPAFAINRVAYGS